MWLRCGLVFVFLAMLLCSRCQTPERRLVSASQGSVHDTPHQAIPASQDSGTGSGRGRYLYLDRPDAVPAHDAYVTWKDHGRGRQYALYYWGEEPVGRGRTGFDEILARMKRLPRGSRVLLYPEWRYCSQQGGFVFDILPAWGEYQQELHRVAMERGLAIIFSPRDHHGDMCPESIGGEPLRAPVNESKRFPIR